MNELQIEAQENLRVIRTTLERAKPYSNFAGLSGIFGGVASIVGAFAQRLYVMGLPRDEQPGAFATVWLLIMGCALAVDFLLTRRRTNLQDRAVLVQLSRQMAGAALPSLLFGVLLTLWLLSRGEQNLVYPYWMLSYGCAISAVGLAGQKEIRSLGWSFLVAGSFFWILQTYGSQHLRDAQLGLAAMVPTFGFIHIAYGIVVARREGL